MRNLFYALPIVFMAALALVFYQGLGKYPNLVPSALIGDPAPQFALPALLEEGSIVSSQSFEDKVVLVNFFASWCGPCRIEHPLLMRLEEN